MRKLIVFVVVVAALLLGIDRGGDFVAERFAADNLQSAQHLQQRPDVTVAGFPFITQFVSGHYQHIEVVAQDVRVPRTSLYVSQLHADMRTVTVSHTFDTIRAKTASARATVDYADLSRLLHVRVHYGGDGELALTRKLPLIGRRTVRFKAIYADGVLRFGQSSVNGLSRISGEIGSLLERYLGIRTSLRRFPFDVHVRSIGVDAHGIEFTLTGRNLVFRK